ncbi:hypothetical protein DFH28DRAFT_896013 [Melampsora americana]|nr:hypothetical protein DFH28DRAFT_896013 [Melampsora americana]
MSHNHSHSPSQHSKLTHLTRDRSSSLPQSNMNPSEPNAPYSYKRKGSLPYNNLPRYPPNEQASDQLEEKNKLPSLPLPRKASLGASSVFGDDYVPLSSAGSSQNTCDTPLSPHARPPLSSPARSSGTSTYSRRKFPTIGQRQKLPPVEPLKIVKRCAGHTPSGKPFEYPTSPSSGFPSLHSHIQELIVDPSTSALSPQILSAPLERFENNSVGDFGQASAVSVDGTFKNNETTGYVYKPSAVVLTDEYYYYQNSIKQPLQRSSSVSRVRKVSGSLLKIFKGSENNK